MTPEETAKTGPEQGERTRPAQPARRGRHPGRGRRGRGRRPPQRPPQEAKSSVPGPAETSPPQARPSLPAEQGEQAHEYDREPERDYHSDEPIAEARDRDDREQTSPLKESPEPPPPPLPPFTVEREVPLPAQPRHQAQPASAATIQGAIDEVNRIIDTLKESLDEMEEVLETLELAERQKTADEQELESLRRALRQLQQRQRH